MLNKYYLVFSVLLVSGVAGLLFWRSCRSMDFASEFKMPSGVVLGLPQGFSAKINQNGDFVQILDPDNSINIFIKQTVASDLKPAIDEFWKEALLSFAFEEEQVLNVPDSNGWDKILVVNYKLSKSQQMAQAIAQLKGNTAYVLIIEGLVSDISKRGAQIMSIWGCIKADSIDLRNTDIMSISDKTSEISDFITLTMNKFDIPGLSIAIVENGKAVFCKGFGIRGLGESGKVDQKTEFMIGSTSKSLTTLLMAKLIDDGYFSWTTKVTDVYPSFMLGDSDLAKKLEMEHLVSACTGIPRKDLPMILNSSSLRTSEDQVFDILKTLYPTTGFKETFQYQNQLVAAAGYISAYAVDPSLAMRQNYHSIMQKYIFTPLGMSRTVFTNHTDINAAFPHSFDHDGVAHKCSCDLESWVAHVDPAGGIWSTAEDMSKYLIAELSPEKNLVASEKNFLYRRTPQVKMGKDSSYALGWMINKKHELEVVTHSGGTMGFSSDMVFWPEKHVGIVILTNSCAAHSMIAAIEDKIFELWFGVNEKSEEKLDFAVECKNNQLKDARENLLNDPVWMNQWVGKYENKDLGIVSITRHKDSFFLSGPGIGQSELSACNRKAGMKAIMVIGFGPAYGLKIIPGDDNGSFFVHESQHEYVFERLDK